MRKRNKSNKKATPQRSFSIGESVMVNPGVKDPDYGIEIGGWQGRLIDNGAAYEQDDPLVTIVWDSITLKQMPVELIERCEEDGLDWAMMMLYASDVMPTAPRDNPDQVDKIRVEIEDAHEMDHLGEQGRRIQKILNSAVNKSEMGRFNAWENYLSEKLTFPFEAEVSEYQEHGPMRGGEHVSVLDIEIVDDS